MDKNFTNLTQLRLYLKYLYPEEVYIDHKG